MLSERLLQEQRKELQEQFDKLSDRILCLRKDVAVATDSSIKLRLETEIEKIEKERANIDEKLETIEVQTKRHEIAKNQIFNHLKAKGFQRMSFERVSKEIDPEYNDDFLMEIIRKYPEQFRRVRIKGGQPGISIQ